jgi:putative transcriptional regulator
VARLDLALFLLHDRPMETVIAPGFLVAAPQLKDPNFDGTVIFMIEHDDTEGSLGLVINRATELRLARVLSEMSLPVPEGSDLDRGRPVLYGGPVSPELGWIVHTPDWNSSATKTIAGAVGVTASLEVLKAIASGKGPRSYVFCLGYAGWGPGQLVDEIKEGSWFNVPFGADLIFDVPLDERWNNALARLGIDPLSLAPMVGDA